MARRSKDVFGVEELEKNFDKLIKKYPQKVDATLMSIGRAINRRIKQRTPVYKGRPVERIKPGQLRKSWKLNRVKEYKNGTVRVIRIKNEAPHAHLIEQGHKIVQGRRTRDSRGRYAKETKKLGRTSQYDDAQKRKMGIKTKGFVEGEEMMAKTFKDFRERYGKNMSNVINNLIEEFDK